MSEKLSFLQRLFGGEKIKRDAEASVTKAFTEMYGLRDPNKAPVQTPDFIPYTTSISGVGGTQQNDILLYFFNRVDAVHAIISFMASIASQIPVKHVKKLANGKEKTIDNSDAIKLLASPNPYMTGRTYTQNAIASFFVYGNVYQNKIRSIGFDGVKELWLLPSNRIWVKTQQSSGDFGLVYPSADPRNNPIISYNWKLDGKWLYLQPEEVGHLKDMNLLTSFGQYLYGQSRLYSATRTIESLIGMADIVNSLVNNGGAGGFVTKKNRPGQVDTAMDPDEKKKIEDHFHNHYGYGYDKKRLFFTDQELSYQKIDAALSDYMPVVIKEHEFRQLCNVLGGFPASILNDPSASTYNNVETAQKSLYVNVLQPVIMQYYQWQSNELGLTENGEALEADFEAVEVLQTNKKAEAQKLKIIAEGVDVLLNARLITPNQALELIGLDENPDPEFDKIPTKPVPLQVTETINPDGTVTRTTGGNEPPKPGTEPPANNEPPKPE